jgi:hypothetical protein
MYSLFVFDDSPGGEERRDRTAGYIPASLAVKGSRTQGSSEVRRASV